MKYKLFHKQRRFTTILMLLTRPNLYCTAHLHVLRTYKRPGNIAVNMCLSSFYQLRALKRNDPRTILMGFVLDI